VGQRLGLIIGNSVYLESSLTRLITPDVDVGSLAEVLLSPEIGGFDDVNVLVNTSSATVRRAISGFFAGKKRDDLLVLYFSGHGVLDQQGRLFLAVKDTDRKLLRGTAIPAAFITDEMNNSRSKRQVLILDCCHSGAFARGTKGAPGSSVGTATAFEGTGFGRVVLTASDATQYAWEGDQVIGQAENSLFTHYLTRGLESGEADSNRDGQITVDEIYDYVYAQVVKQTPKQTPGKWSYREQGEIVIAHAPQLEAIPLELAELPEGDKEQQARLEEYYTKGLSAAWLEEWEEAARYFQAIVDVQPDYEAAAEKLQAARTQIRRNNLYSKAIAAKEANDWTQGISALEILVAEAPDFKDAVDILQFMKKKKTLTGLYAEAQRLSQAGQWQAVVNIFARIAEIDPDYPDPQRLLKEAERQIVELQRQDELKDVYGRAVREMEAGRWESARQLFIQIQDIEPGYQKTEELLARVQAELTRQESELEQQEQFNGQVSAEVDKILDESGRGAEISAIAIEEPQIEPQPRDWKSILSTPWVIAAIIGVTVIAVSILGVPFVRGLIESGELFETTSLGIGSTWVSPVDGMVMVYVPEGEFLMGSEDSDSMANDNEKPQHRVYLDAFWIDQTEVTNAMFRRFVSATGYKTDAEIRGDSWVFNVLKEDWEQIDGADWQHPRGPTSTIQGLGDHPVVQVSWNDSLAYCQWAERRLPTEAEWEKAARGEHGQKFPWGDQEVAGNLLNFADSNLDVSWADINVDDGYEFSAPAGNYLAGASPYGGLDMAGNVYEWVADWYDSDYYASSPDSDPQGAASGENRVERGGSWSRPIWDIRPANRDFEDPNVNSDLDGFRCARSP
jgi:formylglycine-generating enzyme required for sulfatase activity